MNKNNQKKEEKGAESSHKTSQNNEKKKAENSNEKIVEEKQIDEKQKRIEELEKQVEELKSDFLRSRADYENYKKRVEKEKQETKDNVIADFVLDLLPAIDNFEISLKMTNNTAMFVKGVEMIHKNLIETLKQHKIESFEAKEGTIYDIKMHDPIPIEDKTKENNIIVSNIQKGFKHKENILRPAKVKVIKND